MKCYCIHFKLWCNKLLLSTRMSINQTRSLQYLQVFSCIEACHLIISSFLRQTSYLIGLESPAFLEISTTMFSYSVSGSTPDGVVFVQCFKSDHGLLRCGASGSLEARSACHCARFKCACRMLAPWMRAPEQLDAEVVPLHRYVVARQRSFSAMNFTQSQRQ